MYNICTYFDKNYLNRGLALYNSLKRQDDDFVLFILCMDQYTYNYFEKEKLSNIKIINIEEFESKDKELKNAKQNRSLIEYYFTCTPCLPLFILNQYDNIEIITYVDADHYFFSSIKPLFDAFENNSVLIIEHRFPPRLKDEEKYGYFNVGILSFRNDNHGNQCLVWWRKKCIDWCYDRLENGKFADQKYLDEWPKLFKNVLILKHKGIGLAPWNLESYNLINTKRGLTVDSENIITYHFHGLKKITNIIYDSGYNYGSQMNRLIINMIYKPYINELRIIDKKLFLNGIKGSNSIRKNFENRLISYIIIFITRQLLICFGSISFKINLKPLSNFFLKKSKSKLS